MSALVPAVALPVTLARCPRGSTALSPAELAALEALRLSWDRRQQAIDTIVRGVQRIVPTFGRRRMTLRLALEAFRREGLVVDVRISHVFDGQLRRAGSAPRVLLKSNLSREAAVFAAFHELAHWVAHPTDLAAALADGTLTDVEREANTMGYLALMPHVAGPPYPILVREDSRKDEDEGSLTLEARHATGPDTWEVRTKRIAPWYAWQPPSFLGCAGQE